MYLGTAVESLSLNRLSASRGTPSLLFTHSVYPSPGTEPRTQQALNRRCPNKKSGIVVFNHFSAFVEWVILLSKKVH